MFIYGISQKKKKTFTNKKFSGDKGTIIPFYTLFPLKIYKKYKFL